MRVSWERDELYREIVNDLFGREDYIIANGNMDDMAGVVGLMYVNRKDYVVPVFAGLYLYLIKKYGDIPPIYNEALIDDGAKMRYAPNWSVLDVMPVPYENILNIYDARDAVLNNSCMFYLDIKNKEMNAFGINARDEVYVFPSYSDSFLDALMFYYQLSSKLSFSEINALSLAKYWELRGLSKEKIYSLISEKFGSEMWKVVRECII